MVEQGSMCPSFVDLQTKAGAGFLILSIALLKLSKLVPIRICRLLDYLFTISTQIFSRASLGPFEMADFIGLDKAKKMIYELNMDPDLKGKDISNNIRFLWKMAQLESRLEKGDILYKESQLLNLLISEGKLGRKSGEGFYSYIQLPNNKLLVLDKRSKANM